MKETKMKHTVSIITVLASSLLAGMASAEMISPEAVATNRAAALKANIVKFDLHLFPNALNYSRALGKTFPFYQLHVTAFPFAMAETPANLLHANIDQELAGKLVDHLLADGFLARASKVDAQAKDRRMPDTGYILRVTPLEEDHLFLEENLGFDLTTLAWLDGLRACLAEHEPVDVAAWRIDARRAWLCPACKDKMFIQSVGKCSECGGFTSSSAYKLCSACSARQKRCQACGCAQVGPATAAVDTLLAQLDGFRGLWEGTEREAVPLREPKPLVAPDRIPVAALPSITDAATGMTVSVEPEKGAVSAYMRDQRIVWQFKTGQRRVDGVALVDGNVVLQPGGETLDLQTGKRLWKP